MDGNLDDESVGERLGAERLFGGLAQDGLSAFGQQLGAGILQNVDGADFGGGGDFHLLQDHPGHV